MPFCFLRLKIYSTKPLRQFFYNCKCTYVLMKRDLKGGSVVPEPVTVKGNV